MPIPNLANVFQLQRDLSCALKVSSDFILITIITSIKSYLFGKSNCDAKRIKAAFSRLAPSPGENLSKLGQPSNYDHSSAPTDNQIQGRPTFR